MGVDKLVFGWIDYCLFSSLLGVSLLIGIYFGFFSKQDSTSEYLFGGKTMNYVPVAISILASLLSGITFLGVPTEVYLHGSQYFIIAFSAIIIGFISAYITMPVFHQLQVSSVYEYLEMRFSKTTKTFASILYIISVFMYIPIVIYVPALAFSQVTGYNIHTISPIFCIVCITYTSMGGVKAVVWTDTIQFLFTIVGLATVLTLGIISIGGISEVWRIADEGKRTSLFDMDPNPLRRDTFWSMALGVTFSMLSRFGLGQKFVQRYLAIEKKSNMTKAIFLTAFGWGILQTACVLTGLVLYAQYHDCDPLKAKQIERSDQILPYYVMDIAGHLSGLPGIFLAGLVSSALSTMSASLNTLSGLIYDTFIDNWLTQGPKKEVHSTNIMKVISVIIGIITIALIFVVERLGTVFEMAVGLSSATEGALLGLFIIGLLCPLVGNKGAMIGACSSLAVMSWIVGGVEWHMMNKRLPSSDLPTSIENCPYPLNETMKEENTTQIFLSTEDEPMILFKIAVVYFTLIGCLIVVIVGHITSYFFDEMNITKVNPDHFAPCIRRFLPKKEFYTSVPLQDDVKEKIVSTEKTETNI